MTGSTSSVEVLCKIHMIRFNHLIFTTLQSLAWSPDALMILWGLWDIFDNFWFRSFSIFFASGHETAQALEMVFASDRRFNLAGHQASVHRVQLKQSNQSAKNMIKIHDPYQSWITWLNLIPKTTSTFFPNSSCSSCSLVPRRTQALADQADGPLLRLCTAHRCSPRMSATQWPCLGVDQNLGKAQHPGNSWWFLMVIFNGGFIDL